MLNAIEEVLRACTSSFDRASNNRAYDMKDKSDEDGRRRRHEYLCSKEALKVSRCACPAYQCKLEVVKERNNLGVYISPARCTHITIRDILSSMRGSII